MEKRGVYQQYRCSHMFCPPCMRKNKTRVCPFCRYSHSPFFQETLPFRKDCLTEQQRPALGEISEAAASGRAERLTGELIQLRQQKHDWNLMKDSFHSESDYAEEFFDEMPLLLVASVFNRHPLRPWLSNMPVIKVLLDHDADINATSGEGETTLGYAIIRKDHKCPRVSKGVQGCPRVHSQQRGSER